MYKGDNLYDLRLVLNNTLTKNYFVTTLGKY